MLCNVKLCYVIIRYVMLYGSGGPQVGDVTGLFI